MPRFAALTLRCFALVAAGLVLVGSALFMSLLLLAVWAVRSIWLKMTGRPAVPFVVRGWRSENVRRGFRQRGGTDVIDVQARHVS